MKHLSYTERDEIRNVISEALDIAYTRVVYSPLEMDEIEFRRHLAEASIQIIVEPKGDQWV